MITIPEGRHNTHTYYTHLDTVSWLPPSSRHSSAAADSAPSVLSLPDVGECGPPPPPPAVAAAAAPGTLRRRKGLACWAVWKLLESTFPIGMAAALCSVLLRNTDKSTLSLSLSPRASQAQLQKFSTQLTITRNSFSSSSEARLLSSQRLLSCAGQYWRLGSDCWPLLETVEGAPKKPSSHNCYITRGVSTCICILIDYLEYPWFDPTPRGQQPFSTSLFELLSSCCAAYSP